MSVTGETPVDVDKWLTSCCNHGLQLQQSQTICAPCSWVITVPLRLSHYTLYKSLPSPQATHRLHYTKCGGGVS